MYQLQPKALPQAGATMTEVLVAVVILTLGIVSMVNLQTTALKLNQTTYLRSQAVSFSYQILDAMRANRSNALNGDYDCNLRDRVPIEQTPTTQARRDLQLWLRSIENAMRPFEGTASIANDDGRFTIVVQWRNRLDEQYAGDASVRYERSVVVTDL